MSITTSRCHEDNKVCVVANDAAIQWMQTPTTRPQSTLFGRFALVSLPYLFITEPWLDFGLVHVYRWCNRYGKPMFSNATGCQFRLAHQIASPTAKPGFGKALAFHDPFLFITDCVQSAVYVWCPDTGVHCLYQHPIAVESIGFTIEVTESDHVWMITVEAIHRGTLERFPVIIQARRDTTVRHHLLRQI